MANLQASCSARVGADTHQFTLINQLCHSEPRRAGQLKLVITTSMVAYRGLHTQRAEHQYVNVGSIRILRQPAYNVLNAALATGWAQRVATSTSQVYICAPRTRRSHICQLQLQGPCLSSF